MTDTTVAGELVAAVEAAEAEALRQHQAGTCHLSEWSCSYCEANAAAVREVGWVAREARALIEERVPEGSPRREAYMDRKRALLAYIEARP